MLAFCVESILRKNRWNENQRSVEITSGVQPVAVLLCSKSIQTNRATCKEYSVQERFMVGYPCYTYTKGSTGRSAVRDGRVSSVPRGLGGRGTIEHRSKLDSLNKG
jgi:hypothetical protein